MATLEESLAAAAAANNGTNETTDIEVNTFCTVF